MSVRYSGGGSFSTLDHISSPSHQPKGGLFTTMDHNDFMLDHDDGYEMRLNFENVCREMHNQVFAMNLFLLLVFLFLIFFYLVPLFMLFVVNLFLFLV